VIFPFEGSDLDVSNDLVQWFHLAGTRCMDDLPDASPGAVLNKSLGLVNPARVLIARDEVAGLEMRNKADAEYRPMFISKNIEVLKGSVDPFDAMRSGEQVNIVDVERYPSRRNTWPLSVDEWVHKITRVSRRRGVNGLVPEYLVMHVPYNVDSRTRPAVFESEHELHRYARAERRLVRPREAGKGENWSLTTVQRLLQREPLEGRNKAIRNCRDRDDGGKYNILSLAGHVPPQTKNSPWKTCSGLVIVAAAICCVFYGILEFASDVGNPAYGFLAILCAIVAAHVGLGLIVCGAPSWC
jgi:hypothetical protein